MYEISPVFLIFPLFALVASLVKQRVQLISIGLFFILILAFSGNGADYESYRAIYEQVGLGIPFGEIHSEFLYLAINWVFIKLGFGYEVFKIVFTSASMLVVVYYTYQLSKHTPKSFCLSMFLLYSIYLLYIMTIYRQFAVMGITLAAMHYYFNKNKKVLSVCLLLFGCLIHISSAFSLVIFSIYLMIQRPIVPKERLHRKSDGVEAHVWMLLAIIATIVRLLIYAFSTHISAVMKELDFFYTDFQLFSLGFLSRFVPFMVLVFFKDKFSKSRMMQAMFVFYSISVIFYIAIPYDLVVARLALNLKILEIFLIPYLISTCDKHRIKMNLAFILYGLSVLINQLINQGGYFPYTNIVFG